MWCWCKEHTHTSIPDISEGITLREEGSPHRLSPTGRDPLARTGGPEGSVTNQQLDHQVETAAE